MLTSARTRIFDLSPAMTIAVRELMISTISAALRRFASRWRRPFSGPPAAAYHVWEITSVIGAGGRLRKLLRKPISTVEYYPHTFPAIAPHHLAAALPTKTLTVAATVGVGAPGPANWPRTPVGLCHEQSHCRCNMWFKCRRMLCIHPRLSQVIPVESGTTLRICTDGRRG